MKAKLFFSLLLYSSLLLAQNDFPAAWQGEWVGTLEIFTSGGKAQELPMELHILPTGGAGEYTWTIIYGEDVETGLRPYELLTLNQEKGWYLIDEKNTIRMEAYLLSEKFFQWFEVEGSLIFSSTELSGDELVWELVSGRTEPASLSGGQEFEGETIPPVKTFPINVLQKAKLKRKA